MLYYLEATLLLLLPSTVVACKIYPSRSPASLGAFRPMAYARAFVALLLAVLVAIADSSSLSTYWQHELPHTAMPEAFVKLESPLSSSDTQNLLTQMKAGTLQEFDNQGFCSAAGIYCPQMASRAVIVRGPQPRVCIPPFFNYEYGVLPCRHSATASSVMQASTIFVSQSSLVDGQAVHLPDSSNDLKGLKFLPSSIAKALPVLESRSLPALVRLYGVKKGSDMELDAKNTLAHCSYKSEHEVKACVTSGESMISFVAQAVGRDAVVFTPSATHAQLATVLDVSIVSPQGSKVAACHDMKFPSLLYSCHMMRTAQLMDVSLKLASGEVVHKPIVCHMDTSYWNPSHVAFQALNTQPGKSSICHWFPENSFIFVQGLHG